MSIHQSIELFVAINLLATGLSHFLQPKTWVDFFKFLAENGTSGNIFNAMLSIGTGSIIFSFHLVWTWPKMIITLYGLLLIIKGFIYLIFPEIGLKSIRKVNYQGSKKFRWVGLLMSFYSLFLFYGLFVDRVFY
ncbi:hypothetical protein [Aquimarina sp. 2201CG5-10]|uniref:hypothetical protein n=1 Tax=Aquimarina callyspongiae TaxID=3098150 RepID=UPI002AB3BD60|nr:hypothetical protein [Aquimarina sp. 2201CG5-10]MDY8137924.1 hypothetical protein [Aquimarina sp. 2201CG5-10]